MKWLMTLSISYISSSHMRVLIACYLSRKMPAYLMEPYFFRLYKSRQMVHLKI